METYCQIMGDRAIMMLAVGCVSMFVSAGCLMHIKYQVEFDNGAGGWIAVVFWGFVFLTVSTVVTLYTQEDRMLRRTQGPYAAQWKNNITGTEDLFAKVKRSGQELRQSANSAPLLPRQLLTAVSDRSMSHPLQMCKLQKKASAVA